MRAVCLTVVALSIAATTPAAAQFPGPKPETLKGVPLKPARLPDGHPNWTGFWVTPGGFLETYRGPGGLGGMPKGFVINVPTTRRDIPVMKSPYKEKYAEIARQAAAGTYPDRLAACYPPGMPGMMGAIYGLEILQTPNAIAITSEWQAASRRIWMDLKQHPPADELDDTYAGHSIGHWEGDTLVVSTVGIREDVPIDFTNIPHSPKLEIVERFTQISPGVLVDEITIKDPDLFETDWTYKQAYVYKPALRLKEYTCLENNRNVGADGRAVFE